MSKKYLNTSKLTFFGIDDTGSVNRRAAGFAKQQNNMRIGTDGRITKLKGRSSLENFTDEGTGNGLIISPAKVVICNVHNGNKSIYFNYNGTYYTATLATGDYQTHAALAAALQTALNAQIAGTDPFTVTYNSDTIWYPYKYIISADDDFIIAWKHTNTTSDPAWFGFIYGAADATASTYAVRSEYKVYDPPYLPMAVVAGKPYSINSGHTEITYEDSESVTPLSGYNWTGVWNEGKWYGTDGMASYIIRNGKFIKKQLQLKDVNGGRDTAISSAIKPYNVTSGTNALELTSTVKGRKILISGPNSYDGWLFIDHISYHAKRTTTTDNWVVGVYWLIPEYNYKKLIKTIYPKDITSGSTPADYTITLPSADSECVPLSDNTVVSTPGAYLSFELLQGTGGFFLYGDETEGTADHYTLDANGVWSGAAKKLYITASVRVQSGTGNTLYKMSVSNSEGTESELSDPIALLSAASRAHSFYAFCSATKYDVAWINIYRTEAGGNVYYRVGQIPNSPNLASYWGSTVVCGCSDVALIEGAEADTITVREQMPAGRKVVWFDSRAWVLGAEPDVLYYSNVSDAGLAEPDKFDLSKNVVVVTHTNTTIGDIIAGNDMLLAITKQGLYAVYPQGSGTYAAKLLAEDNVGTASLNSGCFVMDGKGAGFYFQGTDGHFYYYAQGTLTNLSLGRLNVLVAAMDKSKLDKTYCIYDHDNREILWSIYSTTGLTQPDKNVVYSIDNNAFYTDSMPGYLWAYNPLSSGTEQTYLDGMIHTASGDMVFHREGANADLGANITATWETGDWDLGEPLEYKSWIRAEFDVSADTTGQTIAITIYLNGDNTEAGTASVIKGTTTPNELGNFILGLPGMSRLIRFKFVNTDDDGRVYIDPVAIEYSIMGRNNVG